MKFYISFEPRDDLEPSAMSTLFSMVQGMEKPEPALSEPDPADEEVPEVEAPPAQPPVALSPQISVPQPVVPAAGTQPVLAAVVAPGGGGGSATTEPEPEDAEMAGPEMPLTIPPGTDTSQPFTDANGFWRMADGRYYDEVTQQWQMPVVHPPAPVRPAAPAAPAAAAPAADKPRKTRRTKAQIEADKAAAAAAQQPQQAPVQQPYVPPVMPQQPQQMAPQVAPQAPVQVQQPPIVAQPPMPVPQAPVTAPPAMPVPQPQAPAMPAAAPTGGDPTIPSLGADGFVTLESLRDVMRTLNDMKKGVGFSVMKSFGVFTPEKIAPDQRLAVVNKMRELCGLPLLG